jgi:hypothetical protein
VDLVWFDATTGAMNFYIDDFDTQNVIKESKSQDKGTYCPESSDVIIGKLFLSKVEFTVSVSGSGVVKYGFRALSEEEDDDEDSFQFTKFSVIFLVCVLMVFVTMMIWILRRVGVEQVHDTTDGNSCLYEDEDVRMETYLTKGDDKKKKS